MAKRLRDVCALPESEPLWRAGRGFVVRDLPWTVEKLRVIPPFEFENWAVIALGGIPDKVQVGDMGHRIVHPNCHWPPGWDFAGERARPGCRFRRRAKNRNPNGIESFSPRLRGRATLGWRPTNFPTRNGLHHLPPNRMKPRWGKIHFTIITRRSRSSPVRLGPSTPG